MTASHGPISEEQIVQSRLTFSLYPSECWMTSGAILKMDSARMRLSIYGKQRAGLDSSSTEKLHPDMPRPRTSGQSDTTGLDHARQSKAWQSKRRWQGPSAAPSPERSSNESLQVRRDSSVTSFWKRRSKLCQALF